MIKQCSFCVLRFGGRIGSKNYGQNLGTTVRIKYNFPDKLRTFHTSVVHADKIFPETENIYAYGVIQKHFPLLFSSTENVQLDKPVVTLEEFNSLLNRTYRNSTASEIVQVFTNVKFFCQNNEINLSDARFDELVNGLMDHCEKLTDEELLDLLNCVSEYPQCLSYQAHNLHDIWSCLDDMCCWRLPRWSVRQSLKFADVWYRLHLGRICDFVYTFIDSTAKKARRLSKEELVQIFFYINVCRNYNIDFQFEDALDKIVDQLSIDELAIVAMGYFKSKSKIKFLGVTETMIKRVIEHSKTVNELALAAILKIVRFTKPLKLVNEVDQMLDSVLPECDRLSTLCNLHIALTGTGLLTIHSPTLAKSSQKIVDDISNVRLKDIERILLANSMFDFDPKTVPDLYETAFGEIHKEERLKEMIQYKNCLLCILNYFSLRKIYSYELMDKVLDWDYIKDTFGRQPGSLPRELFILDSCIDIECPDYRGHRLPLKVKYRLAKWIVEFIPSYTQYKRLTAADKVFLDIVDSVKEVVRDETLIRVDHVLPHLSRGDIILCKDKRTNKFVKPMGFENYILGDIKYAHDCESYKWYALIVVSWNNTIRDSSLPLGIITMKERQLRKIGYEPISVIWNQFLQLTKEQKVYFIENKLQYRPYV